MKIEDLIIVNFGGFRSSDGKEGSSDGKENSSDGGRSPHVHQMSNKLYGDRYLTYLEPISTSD